MKFRFCTLSAVFALFLWHCMLSGLTTAAIIIRRNRPQAGLVRITFLPMSEAGAALLGAMVTLTPGTTVIDVDMERREMLLHLLDQKASGASITTIHEDFERRIAKIFPVKGVA